jgi:hypothetical protein
MSERSSEEPRNMSLKDGDPLEEVREILNGAEWRRQQRRITDLEVQVIAMSSELDRVGKELIRLQSQLQECALANGGSGDAE